MRAPRLYLYTIKEQDEEASAFSRSALNVVNGSSSATRRRVEASYGVYEMPREIRLDFHLCTVTVCARTLCFTSWKFSLIDSARRRFIIQHSARHFIGLTFIFFLSEDMEYTSQDIADTKKVYSSRFSGKTGSRYYSSVCGGWAKQTYKRFENKLISDSVCCEERVAR